MLRRILIVLLLVSLLAGGALAQDVYPEYVNTEGYVPMILEGKGGDDIVLKVVAFDNWLNASDEIADTWAWQYYTNVLNMKFEIEVLDSNNLAERKNLMFAADELPDMMISMQFSTNELLNYGAINGQLADLKPYLTETLTPGVLDTFERYPVTLEACTAPSGAVYTLPFVYFGGDETPSALDNVAEYRVFIKKTWLDALGVENPATISDFLDVLRRFKAEDPGGVGAENVIPLGSCSSFGSFTLSMFSGAYGVITSGDPGSAAVTTEGEVVLPVMMDYYLDYLTFMNTCYNEGLISPDYFTLSDAQLRALNAEGKLGIITDWAHYLSVPETYDEWLSVKPLVLNEGDTPVAKRGTGYAIGGFAMSQKTAYPELCMRFIDYLFTPEGYSYSYAGPLDSETDILFGVKGSYYDEEKKGFVPHEVTDGDVSSGYEFSTTRVYPFNQIIGDNYGSSSVMWERAGRTPPPFEWKLDDADTHYRYLLYEVTHDYVQDGYPPYIYLTEEQTQTVTDIRSMITAHITSEAAKFIIGTRSLTEFDAFREELKGMGIDEYLAIYAEAAK